MLFITGSDGNLHALAYATDCELTREREFKKVSYRGSGQWAQNIPGEKSWSITANYLMAYEPNDYIDIDTLYDEGTEIEVAFATTNVPEIGVDDIGAISPNTILGYKGKAYIDKITNNGTNRQVASMSVNLTGSGALEKITTSDKLWLNWQDWVNDEIWDNN